MKKILIYGISAQAQALCTMIKMEQQDEVVAFIVDKEYKTKNVLLDLPVIDIEKISEKYIPEEHEICLSFGYKNMVHNRQEKFLKCKRLGYKIYSFVSQNAIIYTNEIGEGCNIYPNVVLMPSVVIGDGTFIEAGCIVAHNTQIGAFNFLAPGVHFCGSIKTGDNCFFGGASEIVNDICIGHDSFVGAAGKVSHDLVPNSVVLPPKSNLKEVSSLEMMQHMFKGSKWQL